jgi:hypothetical protein
MKISDSMVQKLKECAAQEMARSIHVEDQKVYARGVADGATVLAQTILENLEEETPVAE